MEKRPYFVFGDIAACAVAGAAAAWLTYIAVPGGWFPLLAMMAGMALGMVAGFVAGTLFSPLFGAFEIALPTALSGMLAGGIVGMRPGLVDGPAAALWVGALIGLVCLAFVYLMQSRLRGEAE